MFTGIVTDVGEIVAAEDFQGTLRRLRIISRYDPETIAIGASIACGGPCLTVVAVGPHGQGSWFEVDAAAETLALTTVGDWTVGTRINLERSLKIGDELGGHIVTGHVDGIGTIVARQDITEAGEGSSWGATARFDIRAPEAIAAFIATKGSVALDGCSLTVNHVEGSVFSILLIPHTLEVTTWGARNVGDRLNLEVDLMARYAARLAEARGAGY
ncbi:MAG: riboflavin synthase [Chelatococcus sp.]|jgi:riboflavin synthase|uniref:riboflavin synthase n=1 Tax=unclassified Chelatococcus TaxID=2638111 RepID=UPI001BCBBC97|nr:MULTISPECIES: riboflavin synthase [unclassified Chelatococcus]CAH1671599.1 Riboflavin synthase [Hyphomicrobiales bacterium]MBS7738483.1 riboflavin synthase [Chelatococcus sp. HY11]MBX3537569.1 riboflavin synthase [Chelatococcus sp.]MBX3542887.1 riboflavin synthase [Chelatococcus sp.]MCO5076986.1 riboflavin synthase [Chelatococcus sp.]